MSEKVKVTQVTLKGQYNAKDGNKKDYYTVFLEDGRTGTCFSENIRDCIEKEVELDIVEKDYQGEKQITFYFPKSGGFKKDYGFERRKTALECAVRLAAMGKVELKKIPSYADNFQKYLKGE